jgi:5-enolpyruvylshikimate-3-phosphate synthase
LRIDEPDGIQQLNSCIASVGARYGEMPDGIVVEGAKEFDGFDIKTVLPAPLAGACAIAALKCRGKTTIADDALLRRWPGFPAMLSSLVEYKE